MCAAVTALNGRVSARRNCGYRSPLELYRDCALNFSRKLSSVSSERTSRGLLSNAHRLTTVRAPARPPSVSGRSVGWDLTALLVEKLYIQPVAVKYHNTAFK